MTYPTRRDIVGDRVGEHGRERPQQQPQQPQPILIRDIYREFAPEALQQLFDYFTNENPIRMSDKQIRSALSRTQVTAPTLFAAGGDLTTTATTFGDLSAGGNPAAGPTLEKLPDGLWLVLFSADAKTSVGGNPSVMGVEVNGAAPPGESSSGQLARNAGTSMATVSAFTLADLRNAASGDVNKLQAKYKVVGAATASFNRVTLTAIQLGN